MNVSSGAASSPTIGATFLFSVEVFGVTENCCEEQVDQAPEPKEKVSDTFSVRYLVACQDHFAFNFNLSDNVKE
jgi:hypothetical protein